jgi:hypothetical protein
VALVVAMTFVAIGPGCHASGQAPPPPPAAPAPAPPAAPTARTRAPAPAATLHLASTGAITLPADLTACAADRDCTYATLGCCDVTPVNRAHAAEVHAALEASGRPYCAVKAACAPTPSGTWNDGPGACAQGRCAPPP